MNSPTNPFRDNRNMRFGWSVKTGALGVANHGKENMPGSTTKEAMAKRLSHLESELQNVLVKLCASEDRVKEAEWLLTESKQYLGCISGWSDRRDKWLEDVHQ